MPNDFARCVARHPDGRWLYHLPPAGGYGVLAVLADGQPMTRISDSSPWWSADHEATRITIRTKTASRATGYRLKDPETASVRFPAELTPQEWDVRKEGGGIVADYMWDLYTGVYIDQPPTDAHIDGPFTVLTGGEPPAPGGPTWNVNLLDSITQRTEYRHLFPGHLSGLRDHLIALIKRMPRVQHCFNGFQDSTAVYVSLRVPYEQPETRWRPDRSRRTDKPLKTGRTVSVTVERALHLPIPGTVPGANYAEAIAEWDRQVTFWTQAVTDAGVAACNHCRGTGHIPAGSETYTPTK